MKQPYSDRIAALQSRMAELNLDAYMVVTDDFHASEYVGNYFKCREFLSGFTGSAGTLVVSRDRADLWTDGRYFLQAREQLADTGITLREMGQPKVPTVSEFLAETLPQDGALGYDGRTVSAGLSARLQEKLGGKNVRFVENLDLAGELWTDRPAFPAAPIWELDVSFAGQSRAEKLKSIREKVREAGARTLLLASLDDIAWLMNLRGSDVSCNPVFMSYLLLSQEGCTLYAAPQAVSEELLEALGKDGVTLRPYGGIYTDIAALPADEKLLLDENTVNCALLHAIPQNVECVKKTTPVQLAKAVKNPTECENIRKAHLQDGLAVTRFIHYIKKNYEGQTELDVCDRLEEYRKTGENYLYQSFEPIAAAGAHGAIIHYEPTPESNVPLEKDNFLLLDSGGQYLTGTTDITRTISLGTLTQEQKENYTAVLRGHLELTMIRFPHGVTGQNLDVLARAPLWEKGMDFNHGTGHGVGYLLNVHEGPNGFRLRPSGAVVFEPGMVTSNEPGLYFEGKYGIRIENMILCRELEKTEYAQFLGFEALTLVPYDRDAILAENLTAPERRFLNEYHKTVFTALSPYLNEEETEWLRKETAPI